MRKRRALIEAEIEILENQLHDPVGAEITLRFTEHGFIDAHSRISVQHRFAKYKQSNQYEVIRVTTIDDGDEKYCEAVLERI